MTRVFVTVLALGAIALVLLYGYRRYAETHHRRGCPSNLRQIGQALMLYVHEHGGAFPESMEPLVGYITPRTFVCPSTNDEPPGDTSEKVGAAMRGGWQASYVYIGAGLTPQHDSTFVVAYDRPENHTPEGSNVLFADGHVDWVAARAMKYVHDEVAAGRLPVRLPAPVLPTATAPTTSPGG